MGSDPPNPRFLVMKKGNDGFSFESTCQALLHSTPYHLPVTPTAKKTNGHWLSPQTGHQPWESSTTRAPGNSILHQINHLPSLNAGYTHHESGHFWSVSEDSRNRPSKPCCRGTVAWDQHMGSPLSPISCKSLCLAEKWALSLTTILQVFYR